MPAVASHVYAQCGLSDCVLVMTTSHEKNTELIEMPFGGGESCESKESHVGSGHTLAPPSEYD